MLKRALWVGLCGSVLLAGALYAGRASANPQVRRLITESRIDESNRVILRGSTRPEANAENDRGALPENEPLEHVWLLMRRAPATEQSLSRYLNSLNDHTSPNYHKWLKPAEFARRFGADPQDVATVSGWLQSHGMRVNQVYPNGVIDFSGTAGQIREAFHTEIHHLEVNGVSHIANMRDPEIPAALEPAVRGVVSLHNFMPRPTYKKPVRSHFATSAGYQLVVPADLYTIYNFSPTFAAGYTGLGLTIAVLEDTDLYNKSNADFNTFRSTFGLASLYPSGSLNVLHPAAGSGGTCTDPGVNADDAEAAIDVEWASAAAPNASIWLLSCADTTNFGGFIAMQNILSDGDTLPNIISISYGESEALNGATANAYIESLYQLAVAQGISILVSSGDEGAASSDADTNFAQHGITVSAFATTAWNVAVGGTDYGDLYACLVAGTCAVLGESDYNATYWNATNSGTDGSALSYVPEIPWNDSCASMLLATLYENTQTFGSAGFCNTSPGNVVPTPTTVGYLDTTAGSGGPSNCFTGTPAVGGVANGTCAGYPKPSWQSVFGNPNDGVRDIPDVSLFAGNGIYGHYYVVCYSDPTVGRGGAACGSDPSTWAGFGGTSVSSPIMAGILALSAQYVGATFLGNPANWFYYLANLEYGTAGNAACSSTLGNAAASTCVFYDVTQGDMDLPCRALNGTLYNCYKPSGTNGVLSLSNTSYQPAYGTTTPGWDFATGIGTVNVYNLVTQRYPVY